MARCSYAQSTTEYNGEHLLKRPNLRFKRYYDFFSMMERVCSS